MPYFPDFVSQFLDYYPTAVATGNPRISYQTDIAFRIGFGSGWSMGHGSSR